VEPGLKHARGPPDLDDMRHLTAWRILIGLLLVAIPYALVRTTDGGSAHELLFAELAVVGLIVLVRSREQARRRSAARPDRTGS
jgi:hypothetical protein